MTVTFTDLDGKTRLTLHQGGFESMLACEAHHAGWTSCLERFVEQLSANRRNSLT